MNEQSTDAQEAGASEEGPERTGNHAVDRVLDSLDGLRDTPVDDQVAVFENAHDQLRKALDGVPDVPRPHDAPHSTTSG